MYNVDVNETQFTLKYMWNGNLQLSIYIARLVTM